MTPRRKPSRVEPRATTVPRETQKSCKEGNTVMGCTAALLTTALKEYALLGSDLTRKLQHRFTRRMGRRGWRVGEWTSVE